jgi:hypothetical protein
VPTNSGWIGFLRNYGPIISNGNSFDETIERARARAGVQVGIRLPAPTVELAIQCLNGTKPTSVILTGTAGDGKTYHCRQIWLTLGGSSEDWEKEKGTNRGVLELQLGDRTLLVVKDLSELNKEDVAPAFFERIFASLSDDARPLLFLIAANVGQLHDEWHKALAHLGEHFPAASTCWQDIEAQLFGNVASVDCAVRLFDLGRGRGAEMMQEVLRQVLDHPAWAGCESCELLDTPAGPCPIAANRERMHETPRGELLRARLVQLVYLQAQNSRHLTVRHQLMLVVNALLGHETVKQHLMTCGDVADIQRAGSTSGASVYQNLFGENLPERQRSNREVFDKLNRVGIGTETSNRIDRLLTYGPDDPDLQPDYDALVAFDTLYGHTTPWASAREAYLEEGKCDEFLVAIRRQRQRLFYTVPEDRAKALGLWELTVYHFAAEFLRTVAQIAAKRRAPQDVVKRLVRGLNRVFTGQFMHQSDALVLASSGSSSQSKTSLIYEGQIPIVGDAGDGIEIVTGRRTDIALRVRIGAESAPVDMDLTVLRFEFLSRVADGALPSSFSLECHEDVLAYKARILRAQEDRRQAIGHPGTSTLRLLEVTSEGHAHAHTIEVDDHG